MLFVAGFWAGIVKEVPWYPLLVVQAHQQAETLKWYDSAPNMISQRGVMNAISTIWTDQGFRGLYRGVVIHGTCWAFTWATSFLVFDYLLSLLPNDSYVPRSYARWDNPWGKAPPRALYYLDM